MGRFVTYLTTYTGNLLPPYYIGSTSEEKAMSGNYFGSVRSKKWKNIFKYELENNKHLFSIKILSTHDNRKEALEEELKLQKENDVVRSDTYFNESLATPNGFFGMVAKGTNSHNYGRKASQETKNKLSIMRKGKPLSDNLKAKLRDGRRRGWIMSEETKLKISKATKGKKRSVKKVFTIEEKNKYYTKERMQKISIANSLKRKGKKLSEKHKEALKKASPFKGIARTEDYKIKMSKICKRAALIRKLKSLISSLQHSVHNK